MNTNDPLDPKAMDLEPSREFDEAAALWALSVPFRRPPAELKARLMNEIRPAPLSWRFWAVPALAFASVLIFAYFSHNSGPLAVVVSSSSGAAGAPIVAGQLITTPLDGQAVVRIGDDAVLKLSHGAEATITRSGKTLEVRLKSGWLLSSVRHGQDYRVVTARGEVEALGTEFFIRVRPDKDYVCICKGRLRLTGAFPAAEIASEAHYDVWMDGLNQPSHASWTMEGHGDEDWKEVRRILSR